jgi:hypothetical protein
MPPSGMRRGGGWELDGAVFARARGGSLHRNGSNSGSPSAASVAFACFSWLRVREGESGFCDPSPKRAGNRHESTLLLLTIGTKTVSRETHAERAVKGRSAGSWERKRHALTVSHGGKGYFCRRVLPF